MRLQRVAGNAAVTNLLNISNFSGKRDLLSYSSIPDQGWTPVVQRENDFGLREEPSTTTYAQHGLHFWREPANADKPLADYAKWLIEKANQLLATVAYPCKLSFDDAGSAAEFSRITWTMHIEIKEFSDRDNVTKVGELTVEEAADVADSIYHEARHCEQYFRIAQVQAGEGKMIDQIAKDMDIPPEIAKEAAAKKTEPSSVEPKMLATIKGWEAITVGIHRPYRVWVNRFRGAVRKLRDLVEQVAPSTLETTKSEIESALSSWKTKERPFVNDEIARVEMITPKTPVEEQVLKDLHEIKSWLNYDIQRWEEDDKKDMTTMEGHATRFGVLRTELYKAYRNFTHEKEAWETGTAAGSMFKALART